MGDFSVRLGTQGYGQMVFIQPARKVSGSLTPRIRIYRCMNMLRLKIGGLGFNVQNSSHKPLRVLFSGPTYEL